MAKKSARRKKGAKKAVRKAKPKRAGGKAARKTVKKAKPKKVAKKARTREAPKKALREPSLKNLQQAMKKVFQLTWKNENALAKHIETIGQAQERFPGHLAALQVGLAGLSQWIDRLERPRSEGRPAPEGTADEALKGAQENLKDLHAKLARVRQALVEERAGFESSLDEVRKALRGDIGTLVVRLDKLEQAPPPPDRLSPEAIQAALGENIDEEARKALAGVFRSHQSMDLLKNLLGPDFLQRTVHDILESGVLHAIVNGDEMKELIDEKFKIMRYWLQSDEIPRQIKRLTGETGDVI